MARPMEETLEGIARLDEVRLPRATPRGITPRFGRPEASRRLRSLGGSRTQVEVANTTKVSQPTVSGLWNKWRRLGLIRDVDGKAVHLVRPSDLGLERL